jgi:hypothetical protein
MPRLLQRGGDLGSVQDLGYFGADAIEKVEGASVLQNYVGGRCHVHCHFWVDGAR